MKLVNCEIEEVNQVKYAILTLKGEGKCNPAMLNEFSDALEKTIADPDVKCLIITGEGKNFSQGFDLETISSLNEEEVNSFFKRAMEVVIERLLLLPMPVVSCINGHAFGLGAMMALASDYRVMREDRGFFCLPESNINLNLTPSMNALVCNKLQGTNLRDILLTGKYIGGVEAVERGIVDLTCSEDSLMEDARSVAEPMIGKARKITGELKYGINCNILPRDFKL